MGEPGRQPTVRSVGSDLGPRHAVRLQSRQRRRALVPVVRQGRRVVQWQRVGGVLSASPSAAAWAPGRLDVFVRASEGSLRHTWFAGRWAGFENLGGVQTAQPAAASVGFGRLDVAVRATDSSMRVKSFVRGIGWSPFINRQGRFTSGPGVAALAGDLLIAGRGSGATIYTGRLSSGGGWAPWRAVDILLPVRRLGTWVDTFDYALDPQTSVARMHALGVRTLYLGTARFSGTSDFFNAAAAGSWLDAAHAAGITVVGWYVPAYGDMTRDLRRTVAIANFVSPGGQRFDAVGLDIERFGTDGEVTLAAFNQRLVTNLRDVRADIDALLVAIVPPPYATIPSADVPHPHWEGFPWAAVGPLSDVIVPMALWSNRDNYTPDQVYGWVRDQITQTESLTGRPVSVEGGVGTSGNTPVTVDRMNRFVDAAHDAGAVGGSHYDYAATTNDLLWPPLQRLNTL